jgi:hypothetical protein
MARTVYIQRKGDGYLETVDEIEVTRSSQVFELLREYRMSDPTADYYSSQRPCNDWRD